MVGSKNFYLAGSQSKFQANQCFDTFACFHSSYHDDVDAKQNKEQLM